MKQITLLLLAALFTSTTQAQLLEAKPLAQALEMALKTKLNYIETAKVLGYSSTSSCLYTSDDLIVIKNYCFPKREYPAKSFTIISAQFGVVQLYQETIDADLEKHDVRIDIFPAHLQQILEPKLNLYKISDVNKIFEKNESERFPGCWSTNFSFYTEKPDANCSRGIEVQNFTNWAAETQKLTADTKQWATLIEKLDLKFDK
jgi:hypothetical protein